LLSTFGCLVVLCRYVLFCDVILFVASHLRDNHPDVETGTVQKENDCSGERMSKLNVGADAVNQGILIKVTKKKKREKNEFKKSQKNKKHKMIPDLWASNWANSCSDVGRCGNRDEENMCRLSQLWVCLRHPHDLWSEQINRHVVGEEHGNDGRYNADDPQEQVRA